MSCLELLCLSLALSADAFAIALCQGLGRGKPTAKVILQVGFCFGLFQALMPLLGAVTSAVFAVAVRRFGHLISCILMVTVGGKMAYEAHLGEDCTQALTLPALLSLSVAGSIDAFAAGVTFICLQVPPILPSLLIGGVTCVLSCIGVKLGSVCGAKYQKQAQYCGACVLIALGLRILAEQLHLF